MISVPLGGQGHFSPHRARVFDLWLAGYTEAEIGRQVGLTRERINQFKKDWPLPEREWGSPHALGYTTTMLAKWARLGWLRPSPSHLYRRSEVNAVAERLLTRKCDALDCTEPRMSLKLNRRFCKEHSVQVQKYDYWLRPERRASHRRATEKWYRDHPERARYIARRAGMVWQLINKKGLSREEARRLAKEKYP